MNLNELIHREGIERLRAAQAACHSARAAHLGLAEGYRNRIEAMRDAAANPSSLLAA